MRRRSPRGVKMTVVWLLKLMFLDMNRNNIDEDTVKMLLGTLDSGLLFEFDKIYFEK